MRVTFLALLLCLVSFPLFGDDALFIESKITVGNSALGAPTFSVISGTRANVSAQGQYDLSLVATSQKNDEVFVSTNLTIDGQTLAPSFLVKLGQESSVSIGETTLTIMVRRHATENT